MTTTLDRACRIAREAHRREQDAWAARLAADTAATHRAWVAARADWLAACNAAAAARTAETGEEG